MYLARVINHQNILQVKMGHPMGHGAEGYANNMLAMSVELYEALQELNWKPWKDTEVNRCKLITELTDALQFWANAALELRCSAVRAPVLIEYQCLQQQQSKDLKHAHLLARLASAAQQAADAANNEGIEIDKASAMHRQIVESWAAVVSRLGFDESEVVNALNDKWEENHARLAH